MVGKSGAFRGTNGTFRLPRDVVGFAAQTGTKRHKCHCAVNTSQHKPAQHPMGVCLLCRERCGCPLGPH